MLGNERLNIEQEFQKRTDGPTVALACLDGAFVKSADGEFCQLVDVELPDDCVLVVRTAALRELEQSSGLAAGGAHVSDKLAKMLQAAAKFWRNANRDVRETHPSNDKVAAWLIQEGFSRTLAEKAATIIRPEWAPLGRKPDE